MSKHPGRLPLAPQQIEANLSTMPHWRQEKDNLIRDYEFATFLAAMAFMVYMGLVSEQLQHHPSWHSNYSKLRVSIGTHDPGGISALDFAWIIEVERGLPPGVV